MFKATFWSLFRYNFKLVVSVSDENELAILKSLNLPIFHIYETYNIEPDKAWRQPQRSLLNAIDDLNTNPLWKDFQYVFYTDADQILHMRSIDKLYSIIESDNFILTPHRLQVNTVDILYVHVICIYVYIHII
jgi:hypothetical protein